MTLFESWKLPPISVQMACVEPEGCCKPEAPHFSQSIDHYCANTNDSSCMRFTINRHSCDLLDMLNSFRQSGKLCDISLRAESCTFAAHRVVLAAASPYFKAMFCSNMVECGMTEVPLHGVKAKVLTAIIDFAYTSKLCVCEENVTQLLHAGAMYQMTHIVDSCCSFLERQLDPSNCIGIADFAHALGCYTLYEQARKYIYTHFTEVSKCEEFLQLSQSQVTQIIKRDELNVRCELEVFEAALRWIRHDSEVRCGKLVQLLSAVRCQFLSPNFLTEQTQTCDVISRVPQCCEFLRRIANESREHQRCTARLRGSHQSVYIIGGYLRHSLASVDCWCPKSDRWYRLASLPVPRSGVSACQVHGKIYVVGGRNNTSDCGNVDSPALDCLDPLTNTWKRCADMTVARNRVGVASLDCMVYAVGGSRERVHHRSVERYDPDTDSWTLVAPMATARIGVGVAVVNRLLYAIGGYDGDNRLSSVECYHPENNEWHFVSPMTTTRSGAGVCNLEQHIYVVGGYDGSTQLSSVERYSVESDQWHSVAPMNIPRSAHTLTVVGGKIYAIGGFDGETFLSSIECYDPAEDQWSEVSTMSCGRSGHGTAIGIEPHSQYLTQSNSTVGS